MTARPNPEAEPKQTVVEHLDEKTIFVRPAWAIDLEDPEKPAKARRRRGKSSRFLSMMMFEIKVLALVVAFGIIGLALLRGFYFAKSEAGIDLVPEVHGPDVAPMLK